MHEPLVEHLNRTWPSLDLAARLGLLQSLATGRDPADMVLTTSFGLEDQVLTHLVAKARLPVRLVTLDTGRMFPETYDLWQRTEALYGLRIEAVLPADDAVRALVARDGINGFYTSPDARRACCTVRKITPLKAALQGARLWITGLRADQSHQRAGIRWAEHDGAFGVIKASPLLDWSRDRLKAFAEAEAVPLNPLHDRGFVSIGCAPCTRAIRDGEDERAGRWWWEQDSHKECGLHPGADGRLVRGPAQEVL